MIHTNFVTKKEFSSSDSAILSIVGEARKYKSTKWMTYSQMRSVGRRPRSGQKGTVLHKLSFIREKGKPGRYEPRKWAVFNEEQTNVTRK